MARWRAWDGSDAVKEASALGDRLWILLHSSMPWFPPELVGGLREALPEAHVE